MMDDFHVLCHCNSVGLVVECGELILVVASLPCVLRFCQEVFPESSQPKEWITGAPDLRLN